MEWIRTPVRGREGVIPPRTLSFIISASSEIGRPLSSVFAAWEANALKKYLHSPAVQAILQGKSLVVVIMPTGGGKTVIFTLPAWIKQGGTTVVVIPLVALRADIQQRCKALGVPYAE